MNQRDLSDAQLIQQVADGDRSAFDLLFNRYAPAVLGLAIRILTERAAAEDVVQEAFWRVWRKAHTFDAERGRFENWLLRIAHNLAIDRLRRTARRSEQALDPKDRHDALRLSTPADEVTGTAWTAIQHQQVLAAMEELPPEQREIIELAYFGGMTRQEIADRTGLPLGTVHTRARLALRRLRSALQARGFER